MIKHIILLRLKDQVDGMSKTENIVKAKALIEGMNGKIPGLIMVELGTDFSATDASADIALYAELESREALEVYAQHPVHTAILPFVRSIFEQRHLIDYEV
ncbi:MAG: hypothetical protein ACI9WS_002182 [Paraglaciecola psychrophila]|jgi:hypothetical protein